MARIKLGPVVTDIAGSIGGMTIQRNRFGYTMRAKPLPLRSATEAQNNVRRIIIVIQAAWQALTDKERLQWDRFLDFSGQTIKRDKSIKLSGHALYIKYQLFRLLLCECLLTTIEYSPMPEVELIEKIEQVGNSLKVYFNAQVDHTKYFFNIKLTSPRRESASFSPSGLRFMTAAVASATNYELVNPYVAAFGVLPGTTSFIHVSIRYFSTVSPVYGQVINSVLQVE